jgi:predicted nucleic acid-binding protein
VLSYPGLNLADKKLIRSFFNECFIIDLESEIKELTIEIRSRYNIKLPDAIIAATGIRFDLPLFTLDKGFKRISELKKLIIEF